MWRWEGYADSDGAYANASVADRQPLRASRKEVRAPLPAAVTAAEVPLFDGPGATESAAAESWATTGAPVHPQVTTPPADATSAAASYLDALFTGEAADRSPAPEAGLARSGPPHTH